MDGRGFTAPPKLLPRGAFPQIQCTEADTIVVQGAQALAKANNRTWQYCPCDNGFEGMKDSKLKGSWSLAPEFQRTDEARPCISWLGS